MSVLMVAKKIVASSQVGLLLSILRRTKIEAVSERYRCYPNIGS